MIDINKGKQLMKQLKKVEEELDTLRHKGTVTESLQIIELDKQKKEIEDQLYKLLVGEVNG